MCLFEAARTPTKADTYGVEGAILTVTKVIGYSDFQITFYSGTSVFEYFWFA